MPTFNSKIIERRKLDNPNTQIHDLSLSWLGTGTPLKSGGITIVLWARYIKYQTSFARKVNINDARVIAFSGGMINMKL